MQAYLEPPRGGGPDRPHRTLAGFAAVHLPAGEEAEVRIEVRPRALAVWDAPTRGWTVPPGRYRLAVGSSSRAIAAHVPLEVPGA
ncbi:fibronectin type III-like domain-contianing protein [Nocardiopsis composta]